jgi:hypothetical protein
MTFSTETKDIFGALALAQASIEGAVKDKVNPAFKSKYADLSSVLDAARGPLKANGLALTIGLTGDDAGVALEALLTHSSGQWVKYEPFPVMVTKRDAQGQGSAVTYGRRYLTMSILGIPAEDDDGNAASAPKPAQNSRPAPGPAPNPAPTLRDQVLAFLGEIKDQLNDEQIHDLSRDVKSAGTTPALLNGVMEKAKRIIGVAA